MQFLEWSLYNYKLNIAMIIFYKGALLYKALYHSEDTDA